MYALLLQCITATIPPVAGRGFSYDDLYVAVSLDLPQGGWLLFVGWAARQCAACTLQGACAPQLRRRG